MGMDPEGKLAYGYLLGGSEPGWKISQVDGDGYLALDWVTEDDEDGFVELIQKRLLASTGFVEIPYDQPRPDDYYKLKNAAEKSTGVKILSCGSSDFPAYVLCTKVYSVEWYDTDLMDLATLTQSPIDGGWDEQLRTALTVLSITPDQPAPGWLLCAFYG